MNAYESLVNKVGEDAAREEMRRRRSKVKTLGKGGFYASNELAKRASALGVAKRRENAKKKREITEEASN